MGFALVVIIGKLAKIEVSLKVFLQEDLLVHGLCRKFIHIRPKTSPYMKLIVFLRESQAHPHRGAGESNRSSPLCRRAGRAISVDY